MPNNRKPPLQRAAGWSDGETSVLIGKWGPVHLRRRRLALKDWRAVASAVNAHGAAVGRRYSRTRAQCQNRVRNLKARYKKELAKPPPSGWRHLPRLLAFLASPADVPPPGFPARNPAVVKEEEAEEKKEEEVAGSGLTGSWTVPRRPRNGAAATGSLCPAAVVTKLADVYERVELARLDAEKEKMEAQQAMFDAVKVEQ